MSWYDSEADWPEYPVQHRVPIVLRRTIRCSRCPATAEVPASGDVMVREQLQLWREGWRRDPTTQTDACPDCAP